MPLLFFVCLLGMIGVMPLHFLSVEHVKLQDIYERLKGAKMIDYIESKRWQLILVAILAGLFGALIRDVANWIWKRYNRRTERRN